MNYLLRKSMRRFCLSLSVMTIIFLSACAKTSEQDSGGFMCLHQSGILLPCREDIYRIKENPKAEWHSFEAYNISDMPDICILDYQYGDARQPGRYVPDSYLKEEKCLGGGGISGPMPRGDYLYVKWRIKSTGKVYEETVDLKSRLPANITDHRIVYMISGTQLFVYLISPERKDGCPNTVPSDEAITCIRERKAKTGHVAGCPDDMYAAMRTAKPIDKVLIDYCYFKAKILYPDQPITQFK